MLAKRSISSLLGAAAVLSVGCHAPKRQDMRVAFASTVPAVQQPSMVRQASFQNTNPGFAAPQNSRPQDEMLVQAWGSFQNPRLRTLQEMALEGASTQTIRNRLAELGLQANGSYADVRRRLLLSLAERYVELRFQQQFLANIHWSVKQQKKAIRLAQIRNEIGDNDVDLEPIKNQVEFLENKKNRYQQRILVSGNQLGILLGRQPTSALIDAIGDQPQLRLPEIDSGLPASVLRRRCDVRHAEYSVLEQGNAMGVPETQMMPFLALSGNIQSVKLQPPVLDSGDFGFDFEFGDDESLATLIPDAPSNPPPAGSHPFKLVVHQYQQVVYSAANEVENWLSQYLQRREASEKLRKELEMQRANCEKNLDELNYDRVTGNELVIGHISYLQIAERLAAARREQAISCLLYTSPSPRD